MGFNNKITLDFQALNLDSILNALKEMNTVSGKVQLPKNLVNQINDLTQAVEAMKASTATLGKTKVDSKEYKEFAANILKSINELKDRVSVLERSMESIGQKQDVSGLVGSIQKIRESVDATTDSFQKMNDAANLKKANPDKQQALKDELALLKDELKIQNQITEVEEKQNLIKKKKGESKEEYAKRETEKRNAEIQKITKSIQEEITLYKELDDVYQNAEKGSTEEQEARLKLAKQMLSIQKRIRELRAYENNETRKANNASDLIRIPEYDNASLKDIYEDFEDNLSEIHDLVSKRISMINDELGKAGKVNTKAVKSAAKELTEEVDRELNFENTKYSKGKQQITVPLHLRKDEYKILKKEIDVVLNEIQDNIRPLEVKVALVSGRKTKKNEELASQLQESLANINDAEIKEKVSKLITTLQKQFDRDLHVNIEVAGQKNAQAAVNRIIASLKKQLSEKLPVVSIQGKFDPKSLKELSKELNSIDFEPIKIDVKKVVKGKDKERSLTKEYSPLSVIKQMIDAITTSVKEKTDAFSEEANTVQSLSKVEVEYLKPIADAFSEIRSILSDIQSLSGTIGDISFHISADELDRLADGVIAISRLAAQNGTSTAPSSTAGVSTKETKKKPGRKKISDTVKEAEETKKLNLELQKEEAAKKKIEKVDSRSSALDNLTEELLTIRNLAKDVEYIKSTLGEDEAAKLETDTVHRLQSALEEFENIDLNRFANIAEMSDQQVKDIAKSLLGITNQQNTALKDIETSTLSVVSTVDKMDHTVEDLKSKGRQYKKVADDIAKSNKIIYSSVEGKQVRYPLEKNATEGLYKIARNPKNANQQSALTVLKMAGDYTTTQDKAILDQIKSFVDSSDFSARMKKSINNSIDRFIRSLSENLEKAVSETTEQVTTPVKTKTVTMGKKEYKEWFRKNNVLGNTDSFDYNFEKHLEGLARKGLATQTVTKSGKKGRWQIKVEVIDTGSEEVIKNLDKIEDQQKEIMEMSGDLHGSASGLSSEELAKELKIAKDLASEKQQQSQSEKNSAEETAQINTTAEETNQYLGRTNEELKECLANEERWLARCKEGSKKYEERRKNIEEINALLSSSVNMDTVSKEIGKYDKLPENVLAAGFETIQKKLAEFGNFNLSKKTDKEGLNTWVEQFIRYQNHGGTRPIEELTDNAKALEKIKKAYASQMENAGQEGVDALAEGVKAESPKYFDTMQEVMDEGHRISRETIGAQSPARRYIKVSEDAVDGLIVGIHNKEEEYFTAIRDMMEKAIAVSKEQAENLTGSLNLGENTEQTTKFMQSIVNVSKTLGDAKAEDRLDRIKKSLESLKEALSGFRPSKSGLLAQIDAILSRADELKMLSDLMKEDKKTIQSTQKYAERQAIKEAKKTEAQAFFNDYAESIEQSFQNLANKNNWKIITSQMEPFEDGLVHIRSIIEEIGAGGEKLHKMVTYATTTGEELSHIETRTDAAMIEKKVAAYERLQQIMAKIVPDAVDIGSAAPGTGEWEDLVGLMDQFGIKAEDVVRVLREIDREGHESFQVFENSGKRTTIGVNSTDILWLKENLLDIDDIQKRLSKDITQFGSDAKKGLGLGELQSEKFLNNLQEIQELFLKLQSISDMGNSEAGKALDKFYEQYLSGIKDFDNYLNTAKYTKTAMSPETQMLFDHLKDTAGEIASIFDKIRHSQPLEEKDLALLKEYIDNTNELNNALKLRTGTMASQAEVAKEIKKAWANAQDNTANKELSRQFRELASTMESVRDIYDGMMPKDQLDDFKYRLQDLTRELEKSGNKGKSFGRKIMDSLTGANARFIANYLSFQDLIRYSRTAFETIHQLDTALIDLKKTTTMSNGELEEFYQNSSRIAKQMGVTSEEIISQASAWSRLGYSGKDAAESMAELSSQFAKISPGTSVEDATDYLVSTMKAFHIDVADVESEIMDAVNRIGNTMATSNQEVGEMLKRSSAAMAAANNSLAETIALESAAVQITRNAETTGTAFRTISMRIRGYDEETEELLEDYEELTGKIADLTKTAATPGGISLFTDASKTEYKSTYQLLKEIAAIYDDLTDKDQAALLESLAGKRGGQVLAGILSDFGEVERAMGEIEQSAGSADKEMQIIEQSLDFKINALRETWVGFLTELADRGALGNLIDTLTRLSEVITGLLSQKDALSGLFSVITGAIAVKNNVGGLKNTSPTPLFCQAG